MKENEKDKIWIKKHTHTDSLVSTVFGGRGTGEDL